MGERSRTYKLSPLFPEGMVTDVDAGLLKPTQAALIQNAIWNSHGDLCKRNGFYWASSSDPLNGNTSKITSAVPFSSPDGRRYVAIGDVDGRLAAYEPTAALTAPYNSGASAAIAVQASFGVYPILAYDNEVICATKIYYQYPLLRWAGSTTAATSGAGTVEVASGDDRVRGTGTNFTTRFPADNSYHYIKITDDYGIAWYYRVEYVESDELLRVSSAIEMETDSSLAWASSPFGFFNISSLVDDRGRASHSTSTVTGYATTWDSYAQQLVANDFIGQSGKRSNIATVTDGVTLTVSAAPTDWAGATPKPYVALRRIFGNLVCEHQNRLHVAGFETHPNRVAVLPAGASANVAYNGVDDEVNTPIVANQAEFFDVPSPTDPGCIRAIVSVREPGGLAVFRDRDFYMVYGEWPSIQIMKISSDVGCLAWRAACEIPGGVAWAGRDGIYIHRPGGGIEDITEGRIKQTWISLVQGLSSEPSPTNNVAYVCVGYIDDHIVVSVSGTAEDAVSSATTYAYNIRQKAWVEWTGIAPRCFSPINSGTNSGRQNVFMSDSTTNRFLSLGSAILPISTWSALAVNGSFLARSGQNAFGPRGDYGRVIDMKVSYAMTGTSPTFTVKWDSSTAATVSTTASSYNTVRIRPGSSTMGTMSRTSQLEIAEASGTHTALRIQELTITQRLRRQRA